METRKWSWIIRMHDGEVLQANADWVDVLPHGLAFYSKHGDEACLHLFLPLDMVDRCSIMNQMHGGEAGFEVIRKATEKGKPR